MVSINLFEHNKTAYENAVSMLSACRKAAIVHPTGTGKSFVGFKLCEDNPGKFICWLSPSEYIIKTQIENIRKVSPSFKEDNIIFITYAKLMLMSEADIDDLSPDFIILDEFHRCGAAEWGKGVERLLSRYANTPVLGLSATAIRYLDNQRNMADELFDGNIASEITLGEAIVRGILNPPKYVLSVFSYQKDLKKYELRIQKSKSKAAKDAGEKYLEALRRALDKADNINTIFNKHMPDKTGKYIVFCANKEHMDEMIDKAPEWFADIDREPHIYSFLAESASAKKEFDDFKKDEASNHLKLLYCIDALNEGIHVDDISGVILLRPTVSPIIYKQQIGRALSAGGKNAVIFDIVLNIENLFSIDAIEEEMQIAATYYRSLGESGLIVNEHFKVIDEVRSCLELFEKLNESLSASWEYMFGEAKKYYEENGDLNVPKRYVTESGYTLGSWLATQKRVYSGKVNGILTSEQIKRLENIGICWENIHDIAWHKFYAAAEKYYAEHGNLLVPATDKKLYGVKLGRWIANLRTYKKSKIKTNYLTDERIKLLDNIGMVWDVFDYIWEQNYHAAVEYRREFGNLNVNSRYVTADGIRLGAWLHSVRGARKGTSSKQSPTPEQIAKLDELGMVWDSAHNLSWEKSYAEAKKYYDTFGSLDIPADYVTAGGCRLGKWIRRQGCREKLTDERIEKLSLLGMTWNVSNPWENKFELLKAYYEENGDTQVPANYVINGVWLGRWLNKQKMKLAEKCPDEMPLTEAQKLKLQSIGVFPSGKHNELLWETQYDDAKNYYLQNGNLNIPKEYIGSTGKKLGRWIIGQRKKYRDGTITNEQMEKLSAIGMVWELGASGAAAVKIL